MALALQIAKTRTVIQNAKVGNRNSIAKLVNTIPTCPRIAKRPANFAELSILKPMLNGTPLLKSHPDLKNVLETPPISYENLAKNE